MTSPTRPTPVSVPWYVRPRIVLPGVAVLVILVALLTPTALGSRSGDPRLSSLSTAQLGARLFHDLTQRIGWQVERRMTRSLESEPTIIHAVLDPVIPLRASETHALLEHVRAGGGLLIVVGRGTPSFMDSVRIRRAESGIISDLTKPRSARTVSCPEDLGGRFAPLWPGGAASLFTLSWRAPPPGRVDTLLSVTTIAFGAAPKQSPAMLALEYGRGRIVVASDPDILRTDALRDCRFGFGVAAVRALEFLRDGGDRPRHRVVFDEFHQAHGAQPGTMRGVATYLRGTPSGRFLLQLAIAGLVLLLATAPRTVAPKPPGRLERRSPLEQVDALARAYAQVGATRTSARRLVRGLRRRVERARRASAADTDDRFLDRVEAREPSLRADVTIVRDALARPVPVTTFASLGPALERIESTLLRQRS